MTQKGRGGFSALLKILKEEIAKMRNLKRVLALVLALTMVLSFAISASAGAFTDVKDNDDYAPAINLLASLGVLKGFEDGTYQPAGTYTREQFAKILYVLVNGKDDNAAMYTGVAPFPDVAADRWSAGYITWAVNLGIINGRDDGNFWPTDVVKYAEACKMFLIAMGYSSTVYTYPYGFIDKASTLKLFEDIKNYSTFGDANRGTIAQMAYNALFAEAPRFGTYTAKEGDTTTTRTKVLIQGAFGVDYELDTVLGTATNVLGSDVYAEKQVALADAGVVEYDENVDDLIGLTVKVWGKADDKSLNNLKVVLIEDAGKDKVYVVNPADVKEKDTAGTTLKFKDNGATRKITVDDATKVEWDGANGYIDADDIKAASGEYTFKLIDKGNNGEAEIVVVVYPEFAKLSALSATKASFSRVNGANLIKGTKDIEDDNLNLYKDAKKDDYVLICAREAVVDGTVEDVFDIVKAEKVENVKFNKIKDGDCYFAGTAYKMLSALDADELGNKYDLYLNANGYVALADKVSDEKDATYILIVDADNRETVSGLSSVTVTGYLADGTKKTFALDLDEFDADIADFFDAEDGFQDAGLNNVFEYTLNDDNQIDYLVYMDADLDGTGKYDADKTQITVGSGKAFVTSDSVLFNLYEDGSKLKVAVFKADDLPEFENKDVVVAIDGGEVECALIITEAKLSGSNDKYGLVISAEKNASESSSSKVFYALSVAIDGEVKVLNTKDVAKDSTAFDFSEPAPAKIVLNSSGKVDALEWADSTGEFDTGYYVLDGEVVTAIPNSKGIELNDAAVVLYDKECNFYTIDVEFGEDFDEDDVAEATKDSLVKSTIKDFANIGEGDLVYAISAVCNDDDDLVEVYIFTTPTAGEDW